MIMYLLCLTLLIIVTAAGMGQSSGEYRDACVSRWSRDTAAIIDWLAREHAHSGVILVGAGVGGWVMLHAAMLRPDLVKGLVSCLFPFFRSVRICAYSPLMKLVNIAHGWLGGRGGGPGLHGSGRPPSS